MANSIEDYKPELILLRDAYMGNKEIFEKKLTFLSNMAQPEQWDYSVPEREPNFILRNYLYYTYDRIKQENKIAVTNDNEHMCFNTGLQTANGNDIFAYFLKNKNDHAPEGQLWYFNGFKQRTDRELQVFNKLPDIADYFTNPADFIFDRRMEIYVDYDHIIDDNYERFQNIGFTDKFIINALLKSSVNTIIDKVKRNYKLAIPQFYTEKGTNQSKIQLLLPLFLKGNANADLALVVDKSTHNYIGKTILTLEWAYVNSRRIVKPDVDWLKI